MHSPHIGSSFSCQACLSCILKPIIIVIFGIPIVGTVAALGLSALSGAGLGLLAESAMNSASQFFKKIFNSSPSHDAKKTVGGPRSSFGKASIRLGVDSIKGNSVDFSGDYNEIIAAPDSAPKVDNGVSKSEEKETASSLNFEHPPAPENSICYLKR